MTIDLTRQLIFQALDSTWPAARVIDRGSVRLREGKGGGQRVSAATALGHVSPVELNDAEITMRKWGQNPLFMVRSDETALDQLLESSGYTIVDPVVIYAVEPNTIARAPTPSTGIETWPPLTIQKDIWAAGGTGPARIDIMLRARCNRTTFLARRGDRAAGVVYVGVSESTAMLHALETHASIRRKGIGRLLVRFAADWAQKQGADWLTLAVTRGNEAANMLYRSLGMRVVADYHYRRESPT